MRPLFIVLFGIFHIFAALNKNMVDLLFILKGFIIGIIVSVPIGPILMLTIQKSVNDGRKAGFSCGLGATAVDTTCAVISAFALSAIGRLIEKETTVIEVVGGAVIILIGVNMLFTKIKEERKKKKSYSPKNFIKATTMGMSNPAALAVMLAVFAFFNMDMTGKRFIVPAMTICAVAAGSALYWYMISRVVAHFGEKFNIRLLLIINRIAGAGVIIFGIYLLAKGIAG